MTIHPNSIAVLIAIAAGCSFPVVHANSWHSLSYSAWPVGARASGRTVFWDRAPAADPRDCIRVSGLVVA